MSAENKGCLGVILGMLGLLPAESKTVEVEVLPYRLTNRFLSAAEVSFFHVLRSVVSDRFVITTKVRLSDLLFVVGGRTNWKYRNKIDRKHVDFVLCDPQTMVPRLVIELDDASHQQQDRSERDEFVDAAFASASFPILHVTAKASYVPAELLRDINGAIDTGQFNGAVATESVSRGGVPVCEKCGIAMVERKASKGANKGKRFWGCLSYPDCRHVVPID